MSRVGHLRVLVLAAALAVAVAAPGRGEEKVADRPVAEGVVLPTENTYARKIAVAEGYLQRGRWHEAFDILQPILEMKEVVFFPVVREEGGRQTIGWKSLQGEVEGLLNSPRTLPSEGRRAYEERYGKAAAALLVQDVTGQDLEVLARVGRQYPYTRAGIDALSLLAGHQYKANNYAAAALAYARLLGLRSMREWDILEVYQAAVAFHSVGDVDNEKKAWNNLKAQTGDEGLHVGYRTLKLVDRTELDPGRQRLSKPATEWPLYRGNAARDAQGVGGLTSLEYLWKQDSTREASTRNWLADGMTRQLEAGLPILPAFFPIAIEANTSGGPLSLVVFRSYFGVHAVDVKTGKLHWESDSPWSLDRMVHDQRRNLYLGQWMTNWLRQGGQRLFWENSVFGTLSTDGKVVYLVEDLQVPPLDQQNPYRGGFPEPRGYRGDAAIIEAILHNELHAYDLKTGKILWQLGGIGETKDGPTNELRDSYFLGPPLPLDGKLYVLTEKMRELRLVCLNPGKDPTRDNPVLWTLSLGEVRQGLTSDLGRRLQAVQLAYSEGILVCPTNAGTIFGVDVLAHRITWFQQYTSVRAEELRWWGPVAAAKGGGIPGWHASAPVLHEGKVIYTPPDGTGLYCLRLHDGTRLWEAPRRREDLYLACVTGGKVAVVTSRSMRALSLAEGKEAWPEIETGLPSGQGSAANGIYYLPLQSAAATKKPEVCAVDLQKGVVVSHMTSREGEVPGNLILFDKLLLSQSTTEVAALGQLKGNPEEIEQALDKNFNDPLQRLWRGELRLAHGEVQGAVDDFMVAADARNHPSIQVTQVARARLHEALTALYTKDYYGAERYREIFEEVCKVDDREINPAHFAAEENRRRVIFLMTVGRGYEQHGKVLQAYEMYCKLQAPALAEMLVPSSEEPALRQSPRAWAAKRVRALLEAARPEQVNEIEERIEKGQLPKMLPER